MPKRSSHANASNQVDVLFAALLAAFGAFDAEVQQRVEVLYAALLAEIDAAESSPAKATAVTRFLTALEQIPAVRVVVGQQINVVTGQSSADMRRSVDAAALDTLPRDLRSGPPSTARGASPPPQWTRPVPRFIPPLSPPAPLVPASSDAVCDRPDSATAGSEPPDSSIAEAIAKAVAEVVDQLQVSPDRAAALDTDRAEAVAEAVARAIDQLVASADSAAALNTDRLQSAADSTIERAPLTRYPEIEYPSEVALGLRTSLLVALLREPVEPPTIAPLQIADVGPAERLPQLEVVLRARGFDIQPSNTQLLDVVRDDDAELRFVLIPRQLGSQTIRVDFYQDGRRIGTVRQQTTVVEQFALAGPSQPVRSEVEPLDLVRSRAVAPDLELCVETDPDDALRLYFSLHSTIEGIDYHHARMGSVRLQGPPLERMQAVYAELSGLAGRLPSTEEEIAYQRRRLARLGNQLWEELFSPELKAAYWHFKDRVRTLLITSDEPWMPWEIVRPFAFDQHNTRVDEPHLCERFVVARWLSGNGPADRMLLRRVRPVAPATVNLAAVQAELAYLRRISELRIGLVSDDPYSERSRVIDLFEQGDFSLLHVAAHGNFDAQIPDNSSISLTGGVLRPSDLLARFGGSRVRPLIFINACHGARAEFAFTGLGGWADRLVRQLRVGAFIGAAWEVNDRLALLFAETFYTALLRDQQSIGESFQVARQRIRDAEPSNSTWLAYVLYADPSATATIITR